MGIEVKAGSALSTGDFKHLKWFKKNIAKERPFIGIVLYSGEFAGLMGPDLWAVPFGAYGRREWYIIIMVRRDH